MPAAAFERGASAPCAEVSTIRLQAAKRSRAIPSASRRLAQSLTRQLRFTRKRIALHQCCKGFFRLRGAAGLFLAQRELVERRGNLIPLRVHAFDSSVFDGGAVELRQGELTLAHAVLRVVRELRGRKLLDE